jgi:nucleotide-binding universal stress UspA family protein
MPLLLQCKADLLVVGSFGRKGEKLDFLGSVSDFTLRSSAASICIVRSTGVL